MSLQGNRMVIAATLVIIAVASAGIIMALGPGSETTENASRVESILIIGNSTDILYPELMEATFEWVESGAWSVFANFVNDSAGWENPQMYDRTFYVTDEEVSAIDAALWQGVDLTVQSEDDMEAILMRGVSIGYHVVITYRDGSWASLFMFLTEEGHILFNTGTDPSYMHTLDGDLLEPVDAFEGLVDVINTVFSDHLERL